MKKIYKYKTRDGKEHITKDNAESHALYKAHALLNDLIKVSCPYIDNESYKVSQDIIKAMPIKTLQDVVFWLSDSQIEQED